MKFESIWILFIFVYYFTIMYFQIEDLFVWINNEFNLSLHESITVIIAENIDATKIAACKSTIQWEAPPPIPPA